MARQQVIPRAEEKQFELNELFFSVTDKKGIIQYGNEVFVRLGGYPLDELIGAPHNIIRHPDMPRAVFQLLWDYLEKNESIAAYVKNMSADGSFYWVLALVMPYPGGYLSLRLKPTSPLFLQVQSLYKEIRQVEKNFEESGMPRKEVIQASLEYTVKALATLGFKNYNDFMWHALRTEMMTRETELRSQPCRANIQEAQESLLITGVPNSTDTVLSTANRLHRQLLDLFFQLGAINEIKRQLSSTADFVLHLAHSVRLASLNLAVRATALSNSGNTLGVIAETMEKSSAQSMDDMRSLNEASQSFALKLDKLIFGVVVATLKAETTAYFANELSRRSRSSEVETEESSQLLRWLQVLGDSFKDTAHIVIPELTTIGTEVHEMGSDIERLIYYLRELHFSNVFGKVEAARIENGASVISVFSHIVDLVAQGKSQLEGLAGAIAQSQASFRNGTEVATQIEGSLDSLSL